MRQPVRLICVVVASCALFAALAAPAGAQRGAPLPDLTVSAAAEPPDFVPLDGDFLASFTVDNQGRGRARQTSLARAYLSIGRVLSADDRRRRVGDRRVRGLSSGRSSTRRMVVTIPASFRQGEYFLIICADVRDVVNETNERPNCHVSGQKIRVTDDPAGAARGPAGPAGPAGPPGPPGPGGGQITIPRKTLSLGTATLLGNPGFGPGDNENSTQQFDLAEVGGVRIRALCVSTTNGDNELPGDDDDGDGFLGVDNDFDTDEDGDEAKILLYLDRPEGNFSFAGPHGKRFNVNAGFGNTTTSVEDPEGDMGGNGKHMAIATAADPESRIAGDGDDADNTVGEDEATGPEDTVFDAEDDWEQAFRNGSIYVATSSGTEFILNAYVGVGVLGSAPDQCTFGGSITVVSR
jgi:CARDB